MPRARTSGPCGRNPGALRVLDSHFGAKWVAAESSGVTFSPRLAGCSLRASRRSRRNWSKNRPTPVRSNVERVAAPQGLPAKPRPPPPWCFRSLRASPSGRFADIDLAGHGDGSHRRRRRDAASDRQRRITAGASKAAREAGLFRCLDGSLPDHQIELAIGPLIERLDSVGKRCGPNRPESGMRSAGRQLGRFRARVLGPTSSRRGFASALGR